MCSSDLKTAGYYMVVSRNGGISPTNGECSTSIFKNGARIAASGANDMISPNSETATVVYMNGTTDYLQQVVYFSNNITSWAYNEINSFNVYLTNQTLTEVVGTTAAAYVSKTGTSQVVANNAITKITYTASGTNDPQSWWNAANNRFIPTIPGYYQVEAMGTYANVTAGATYEFQIWKNGTYIANSLNTVSSPAWPSGTPSMVVYMNGVTDYLEMYA